MSFRGAVRAAGGSGAGRNRDAGRVRILCAPVSPSGVSPAADVARRADVRGIAAIRVRSVRVESAGARPGLSQAAGRSGKYRAAGAGRGAAVFLQPDRTNVPGARHAALPGGVSGGLRGEYLIRTVE